jgi:hypothetical protein
MISRVDSPSNLSFGACHSAKLNLTELMSAHSSTAANALYPTCSAHSHAKRFNEWAANVIQEQIASGDIVGLSPYLKMSHIKPLVLQWCIDSWKRMQEGDGRAFIQFGWHSCVQSLFNVLDPIKRAQAVEEALAQQQQLDGVADGEEPGEGDEWHEDDTDDEKDELDIMKERAQPSRTQPARSSKKHGRVHRPLSLFFLAALLSLVHLPCVAAILVVFTPLFPSLQYPCLVHPP